MSAFTRTQVDAVWNAGGVGGYVTLPNDWADLSSKVFRAINGDRGGVWNPSTPITFTQNVEITGRALVAYGGTLTSPYFILNGAAEWPLYAVGHPFRKRSLLHSCLPRSSRVRADWVTNLADGSLRSTCIAFQTTDKSSITGPSPFRLALRVHDSAKLARATFTFRIPSARSTAPAAVPKFRLYRVDVQGNRKSLVSIVGGADRNGWVSPPTPSSAAAWFNGGLAQEFVVNCDQFNIVDTQNYTYWAEVTEEGPPTSPVAIPDGFVVRERKVEVTCATAVAVGGALTGALVIDGVVTSAGMRVLVKDGLPGAYGNGIWIASAGAWTRAFDFDSVPKLTTNCVISVLSGTVNKGASFQLIAPYPSQIGTSATSGDGVFFGPLVPTGNAYHSVLVEYEDIIDMRFQ